MAQTNLTRFNIRVYGIMLNEQRDVLVVDEERFGMQFTKFPGGGLELGEGIKDCLKREWMEELNQPIEIAEHFYTTDFFQLSGFNPEHQLISIYYFVKPLEALKTKTSPEPFQFGEISPNGERLSFRWIPGGQLHPDMLTFPIDKLVAERLISYLK